MKKVLFRTDANSDIGIGHLMRSVALAQCLRDKGVQIRFLSVPYFKKIIEYLKNQRFDAVSLNIDREKLGGKPDFGSLSSQIKDGFDWVVLDNYYFGYDYQKAIMDKGVRLLFIDDTAKGRFAADILLNHSIKANRLDYDSSIVKRFLLGTGYALIRKEFTGKRKDKNGIPQNILVTLGGSDNNTPYIEKILDSLAQINKPGLKIRVLSGFSSLTPNKTGTVNVEFCKPVFDMTDIYEWADIAICAAGGTCWELCRYGITGIIGILSENQISNAEELDRIGGFKSIGWYKDCTVKGMADKIKNILEDTKLLAGMRRKVRSLVDGKGPERIYQTMEEIENEKG